MDIAKNQILYGPPGTGKTYHTVNKALEILDPDFYEANKSDRSTLKRRFDELKAKGRIDFVTFHQSFSYEDFVEGLRAFTKNGQIHYEVKDGIFKRMCRDATAGKAQTVDVTNRSVWKMSLGNTANPKSNVYDYCIKNDQILLGHGSDIDFSGAADLETIKKRFSGAGKELKKHKNAAGMVDDFVNEMKFGDLVVVTDGNHKFRAIGEIVGDYKYLSDQDPNRGEYWQSRPVKWHRTYSPSRSRHQLMNKAFSQAALYGLHPPSIDMEKLQSLLGKSSPTQSTHQRPFKEGEQASPDAWVLIIDEINRGNIANILGELITLIEPSKRAGAEETLEVVLPYSKDKFSVPDNLYIIGTMNTADRSLVRIDTALRRRFQFEAMLPDIGVLKELGIHHIEGIDIQKMLETLNSRIELLYDKEHTLGHSFFIPLSSNPDLATLSRIFENQIMPLLEEYFFEDWSRIQQILGDDTKLEDDLKFYIPAFGLNEITNLLRGKDDQTVHNKAFKRNKQALHRVKAFTGIYE